MKTDRQKPAAITEYLKKKGDKQTVFVIPRGKKENILKELNTLMNINRAFVYPEIDDVAKYLTTEKYKP
jgi:hypothetical protein